MYFNIALRISQINLALHYQIAEFKKDLLKIFVTEKVKKNKINAVEATGEFKMKFCIS